MCEDSVGIGTLEIKSEPCDQYDTENVHMEVKLKNDFLLNQSIDIEEEEAELETKIEPTPLNDPIDTVENESYFDCAQEILSNRQITTQHQSQNGKKRCYNKFDRSNCDICGKSMHSTAISTHKKLKHNTEGILYCRICVKKFSNQDELAKHTTECESKKRNLNLKRQEKLSFQVACKFCSRLMCKKSLQNHMKRMHSRQCGTYACKICARMFPNEEEHTKHTIECAIKKKKRNDMLYASLVGKFECYICKKIYNLQSSLVRHIKQNHDNEKSAQFPCNVCGKIILHKNNLRKHMILKHQPEIPKCKICVKTFANEAELMNHKSKCQPKNRIKKIKEACNICGKLITKPSMERHIVVFHSEMPSCNICLKTFPTENELKQHKAICILKKRYECELCGKIIRTASKSKHMEFCHNPNNKIACDSCGKLYPRLSMSKHKKSVHCTNSA